MATNPMKRREQNAFLIGIVIGLILVLVVGFLLFTMYNKTKAEFEKYKAEQKAKEVNVVVAKDTIESGATLDEDKFEVKTVIVDMDTENCFQSVSDMFLVDAPDGEKQEAKEGDIVARLEIPRGAIITKNLIEDKENAIKDDTRLKEYNTIILPSELEPQDVVDIRLTLPSGADFIVLSKKTIINCDETTIWMNVDEAEIQIMNSAMVEAWAITGAKLYAVQYADAGMQNSATLTYQPKAEVANLIESDPNVIKKAHDDLWAQWNSAEGKLNRDDYIDSELRKNTDEENASSVESGFAEESATIRTHRSEFIDSLGK